MDAAVEPPDVEAEEDRQSEPKNIMCKKRKGNLRRTIELEHTKKETRKKQRL